MRHNDHVYLAMRDIIEGPEGTKAAVDAIKCGRPPLSGVDPILQAKLGPRYQRKDDKYDPPGEAGFIVVKYMENSWLREEARQERFLRGGVRRKDRQDVLPARPGLNERAPMENDDEFWARVDVSAITTPPPRAVYGPGSDRRCVRRS